MCTLLCSLVTRIDLRNHYNNQNAEVSLLQRSTFVPHLLKVFKALEQVQFSSWVSVETALVSSPGSGSWPGDLVGEGALTSPYTVLVACGKGQFCDKVYEE